METEDCLEEQLFLELENQGKTQSRWRGIPEREDVYSKRRLHHWQRDVPVPTIAAASVFQKGFLCVMVVAKETENTVKLPANDGEKPFFLLYLPPLGTLRKELIASCQRSIWTIKQKQLAKLFPNSQL